MPTTKTLEHRDVVGHRVTERYAVSRDSGAASTLVFAENIKRIKVTKADGTVVEAVRGVSNADITTFSYSGGLTSIKLADTAQGASEDVYLDFGVGPDLAPAL